MKHQEIVKARTVPAWLPWAVLACAMPLLFLLPITHDAIWQIWLGRQMLGGAELYRDLIEVNPPLWFWIGEVLAIPGGDPRLTVIAFFIAATALSVYLVPERHRLPTLAVLLIVPLHDFGQREHFTLISVVPYVFAVAARAKGETPKYPLLIGLFAAVGLCLKPHFLLLPVAMEALIWRRNHVRPETVAVAAFTAAYAVSIPLVAPAYFTVTLPIVLKFYGAFGQEHPTYVMLAGCFLFASAGVAAGQRTGTVETRALVIASLAFLPAVFIQDKGFAYHSLPVRGLLALACLIELIRLQKSPWADALLLGSIIFCCFPFGFYDSPWVKESEVQLSGIPRGSSIIVMTSNPSAAWPMVEEHGLRWDLHEMSPWQVNALVKHPELIPDARRIVAPDLAKKPDFLIMDRRPLLGAAAYTLLPPNYLKCYAQRLRTPRLQSYRRVC